MICSDFGYRSSDLGTGISVPIDRIGLKLNHFTFSKRESNIVVMSENYDLPERKWWNHQGPEGISDDLYVMAVRWHEHGLTEQAIQAAGISYGDNNSLEIDFPRDPDDASDTEKIDWSTYNPDTCLIIGVHPDKDSIQKFPGGECDYLRYVTSDGKSVRIVLGNSLLDNLEYRGIPVTHRASIGESEAEEVGPQVESCSERMDLHHSGLGNPKIDIIVASEIADLNWEDLLPPPDPAS
jgi:hypothetical protein